MLAKPAGCITTKQAANELPRGGCRAPHRGIVDVCIVDHGLAA